ncbi:MAG: hypothetical protein K8R21_12235 [Leptospira sp.]|nr:hypothetical protein [Leptospira sp.]
MKLKAADPTRPLVSGNFIFLPLFIVCVLNIFCSPSKLSNICDLNSKSYFTTVLFKSVLGDGSGLCGFGLQPLFPFKISGTISGLISNGLVLQNNGADDQTIGYAGTAFSFPTKTSSYNVTVKSSPILANCTATNGTGTATADVSNITISCTLKTLNIAGNVTTIAGSGVGSADGIGTTSATFNTQQGIVCDGTNLFIADNNNHTIRKMVLATGQVTTIAGSAGLTGSNDAIGSAARFNFPQTLFLDGTNLYITDVINNTIRKMVLASGQVTTIAGSVGVPGNIDGIGTAATFNNPLGLSGDGTNLYVANFVSHTIRKIVISNNAVTTISGSSGVSGSLDATGLTATFAQPTSTVYDGSNLYIADFSNHIFRKMVLSSVSVTTIAGLALTNTPIGQDGTGSAARFNNAQDMIIDGTNMYIVDRANHSIRKMVLATGVVTTIAGLSGTPGTADGSGTTARFNNPQGVTTDGTSLYISDSLNHRIRKIQ